jgi:hypothetical protein
VSLRAHAGAASLEEHHVAPLSAEPAEPLADADDPEAAPLVERDRGRVLGKNPGLKRPDAGVLGRSDELVEQAPA